MRHEMSPTPTQPHHKELGGNPIRRKRKLVSSGGQKWFKGSPRKSRPIQNRLLPSAQNVQQQFQSYSGGGAYGGGGGGGGGPLHLESPQPNPILPNMLVQFTFPGVPDVRLSVYDQIALVDEVELPTKKKKKAKEDEIESLSSSLLAAAPSFIQPQPQAPEERPLPQPLFHEIQEYQLREAPPLPNAYIRWMDDVEMGEEVEYHVDEEDSAWLDLINSGRDGGGVSLEIMELLMDRLEKESYLQMQSSGLDQRPVIDDDAVCCICMDGECQNSNAILFCDMCNLAVHQECYGVPYIPEGQWLCRRCLQSPSRQVECVLCPNKGGAFKQTDDGRWAHVVCAIWIPEVCFANTVFLEPVDSVSNIPPARWRLCCFICKYKGRGACIQCHKSNCYTAFHVTCAQHAGLCMRMDTVRIGSTVTVRKTAYCDNHAPSDFIRNREGDSSPTVRQKLKACRKMLAEKRSAKPTVSIPTIPPDRVTEIASSVTFPRKNLFIKRLLSYWKLKRIQRNGVPLLRRLQAASNHPPSSSGHHRPLPHDPNSAPSQNDHAWKFLMRLRQDLERARLLCELIRKREKTKREVVALKTMEWAFKATPFVQFLTNVIDELGARDPQDIFAEPVDPEAVPDYSSVIDFPMDLATMRHKAVSLYYDSLFEMKSDFQLMIDNCLLYNSKETIFHRAGLRLQEAGRMIFREAERTEIVIGFDSNTGLHLDKAPNAICTTINTNTSNNNNNNSPGLPTGGRHNDDHIFEEMDAFIKNEERSRLPHSVHISKLRDLVDKVVTIGHPGVRKKRYERLFREIQRVRRLQQSPPKSPRSPKRESTSPKQASSSNTPISRKLRRKSVQGQNEEDVKEETEEVKERPPKRRVVQEMEAKIHNTPTRRLSRSTDNSPTAQNPPAPSPKKNTPLRRITRLSLDSSSDQQRLTRTHTVPNSNNNTTPSKPPIINGIMRNGRRKISSSIGRRGREKDVAVADAVVPRPQPIVDSFSVYRETERQSSDGEEQEDDDEKEDENNPTDEDSSSEEDSDTEEDGSDSSADSLVVSHQVQRVTRGGAGDLSSPKHKSSRGALARRRRDSSSSSSSTTSNSSHSSSSSSDGQIMDEMLSPQPMQLVWAFASGAWSPGVIVDPDSPNSSCAPYHVPTPDKNGFLNNIPVPPETVLARRPPAGRRRMERSYLVLFFDNNSTWQWVTRGELEPLGANPSVDKRRLKESEEDRKRKWVRRAYEKAILHRSRMLTPMSGGGGGGGGVVNSGAAQPPDSD